MDVYKLIKTFKRGLIFINYQWFWKKNKDPFSNEKPIWAPYDTFISNYIERCYLEGKKNWTNLNYYYFNR